MPPAICLDTSIAVDVLRGSADVHARLASCGRVVLPVAALAELLLGAHRSSDPASAVREVEAFAATCEVATATSLTAACWARSDLLRMGRPIPINDVWIAATAIDLSLPLAARDAHFDLVPGLSVERW